MEANNKTTKLFSMPLMKQSVKSNRVLLIAVLIIMCLMTTVINYASSIMATAPATEETAETQKDFYSYLFVLESYNKMAGTDLSYSDFNSTKNKAVYQTAFDMMNKKTDKELSVKDFEKTCKKLSGSDIPVSTYVRQFEYTYALQDAKGCFSGKDLNIEDFMNTMFKTMGISSDMIEKMSEMDTTAMLNQMHYTVIGLLPLFLFIVITANSLVSEQVDRGSMAYVLSTPTKRSAIVFTQAVYLIAAPLLIITAVCGVKIATSFAFFDEVNIAGIIMSYVGMYILVEAVAGICYFGSCLFNQSKRSMAFGGGLAVWFFLASLLGMFGSENMVNAGMGVEELGIFNKLTLVGLFDVQNIETIGTASVNTSFVWKLAVLAIIAVVFYAAGAVKFQKKDLPL
ncbi:ABC transporter permease [Anaerostipes sp.]|uniref:ABC transporter permease n=1 Tax=Anaerostipes sp. TaxID=1872530 RepID=UPI0025C36150|nr:ABC transporter permease subunit [Anaerostipes sp.]MBS7009380.1 ABC transporter permease subunit [Anaerostipes sp.]